MSQPYNGRNMDWPTEQSPSPRRPREGQLVSLPRDPRANLYHRQMAQQMNPGNETQYRQEVSPQTAVPPRPIRPRAAPSRDGYVTKVISRPSPLPQWPLPGPPPVPSSRKSQQYRPPPGRPQMPPQRPPRPSYVPSLLDQARPQQSTPVFRSVSDGVDGPADHGQDYDPSSPSYMPPGNPSAPSQVPQRKSVNLGPPPSSRRGQSSLYSTVSYVSPIIEEFSGKKTHTSFASSAAMPETWGAGSVGLSPINGEAFYEESLSDRSGDSAPDDYTDESRLVRGSEDEDIMESNPVTPPHLTSAQRDETYASTDPFERGTAFMDESSDSIHSLFTNKQTPETSPGTANITVPTPVLLPGFANPGEFRNSTGSPQPPNRFSARNPLKLDIDAVRVVESRGSLTSLPDLIRRATRLASMIERGKRPSSRLDELDFFNEKSSMDWDRRTPAEGHRSGLSDMLAAFPPPVHTPQNNHNRNGSWPLVASKDRRLEKTSDMRDTEDPPRKPSRRCCGMPLWAFVVLVAVILCVVAAAVVLPLEFFVFKNLGNHSKSSDLSVATCQTSLPCLNGGTNVIIDNKCSCICTNGFIGATCGSSGSAGCTTTNLVPTDGSKSINNVTLGEAIPRIIAGSVTNFSIPLSGTNILAKLNSANISCIAQNSLVTFDGQSTRIGSGSAKVEGVNDNVAELKENVDFVSVSALTAPPSHTTQSRDDEDNGTGYPTPTTSIVTTQASLSRRDSPSGSISSAMPLQTAAFTVTEEVLDFARTAVLFVLQEDSMEDANTAQTQLQHFFSQANQGNTQLGDEVTVQNASSINIGGNKTIDLIHMTVDIGGGAVGGSKPSKRRIFLDHPDHDFETLNTISKSGQAAFPRGLRGCK